MKAGKFNKKILGYQVVAGNRTPAGISSPVKKFWFGQLATKVGALAVSQNIDVRGPTWGFTRIDYAQVWAQKIATATRSVGAGFGAGVGTVQCWFNTGTTILQAGATLCATTGQPIMGMIWGQ